MATTKWVLDITHSEIQFKIKHLMISTVTGQFTKFEGAIETEGEDFATAKATFTADIDSISTNNEQRDEHLKNGDFFDAANHPQLIFKSDKIEKKDDENYKIYGTLSLHGVTQPIVLDGEFGGIIAKDPWGNTRVGFAITGKLNRKDFGISFGLLADTANAGLSNEVKLQVNAQFVKQVPVTA